MEEKKHVEVDLMTKDETANEDRKKRKKSPRKVIRTSYRPLYDFLYAEPEKCRMVKMLLGFPFGALIGYGLYKLVISPMDLSEDTQRLLGTLTVFGFACGYSTSIAFRCICMLLIPTFMGKAGRSYIGTFAIAYLISGPIENIVDNAQDVTRSLTCAAELAANQTAAKWKFRMQPIGNVLKDMKEEGFMLNRIGTKVDKAFIPIKKQIRGEEGVSEMEARTIEEDARSGGNVDRAAEVEKETETKDTDEDGVKVEQKYRRKVKFECEDVYNKGIEKCRDVFRRVERRCRDKLDIWPLTEICRLCRLDFLCDLAKLLGKALGGECDTNKVIHPNFGKIYKSSEDSISSMEDGFEVNLQYQVVKSQEDIDYTSVEEMRSSTMHDFKRSRKWVEFIMLLIKRVLGFTFLLVINSAYKYYKKYSSDLKFDNFYISSYFRKIDARRKKQGKKILLPLKKAEAGACISTHSIKLMKNEKHKLVKGTVLLFTRAGLAGMVFFMAHVMCSVMDTIRRHSRVNYRQTGVNHIDVKVGGTGFMSQIVRLFLNGLNTKNRLDDLTSNLECLPRPVAVDRKFYHYVFGIYLTIWILIIIDAYALRLRRLVAGFFFRKREKKRTLHLYNTMLKKRKHFLRSMRRKMKRKAKKFQLSSRNGLLYSLRRQFPTMCACLKVFGESQNRCLVCDEKERDSFKSCSTPQCTFTYCPECWLDLKKKCYACLPLEEFSSTESGESEISEDDDGI